jgi:adenosylhomocysteinase
MEETTTGVIRLRAMERDKALKIAVVAVNDAQTKHMFDNRYGTGQSTLDGIVRASGILLAGSVIVVGGYGWCGRGIALRARGMGADVIVTEVDAIRALEAAMDGFRVMKMIDAAPLGDVFVTATGDKHVLAAQHFPRMKDGVFLCNSGHFDVEIDMAYLNDTAKKIDHDVTRHVDAYHLGGKVIYILGQGRLVNLACAEGHPAQVMDMSFATQALASEWVIKAGRLPVKVHAVPIEIEEQVSTVKLAAMGIKIDTLSAEQKRYLSAWEHGT